MQSNNSNRRDIFSTAQTPFRRVAVAAAMHKNDLPRIVSSAANENDAAIEIICNSSKSTSTAIPAWAILAHPRSRGNSIHGDRRKTAACDEA